MFDELRDKAVLVTGSSTGIGAAAARAFGRLGARVAVHYNSSRDAAEGVAEGIRGDGGAAVVIQGDMADSAAAEGVVAAAIEAFGQLDVLINNAGHMVRRSPFAEAPDDLFDEVMDLNARSALAATRAALPQFRTQGRGNIVNVTSIAARNGGSYGAGVYAASKALVSSMTRSLAKELAPLNIRVNAVAPGVITTPFHDRYSTAAQLEAARQTIPMGRLGTAEECAGTFLFLATDALSSFVTGQVIEVNGGQLMP